MFMVRLFGQLIGWCQLCYKHLSVLGCWKPLCVQNWLCHSFFSLRCFIYKHKKFAAQKMAFILSASD